MREIKFRGKTTDNKYWVNGDLIMSPENEHYQIGDYIIHGGNSFDEPPSASYEFIDVINKTIGQYTGLKDKNGKEIYDKHLLNNRYIVCFYKNIIYLCDISNGDIIKKGINENTIEITGEYFELQEDKKRDIDKYVQQAEREIKKKTNVFAFL